MKRNEFFAACLLLGLVLISILIFSCVSVSRVEQNEIGFNYNVTSGKVVNTSDNPELNFGFNLALGYNERFFIVNSEENRYSFTNRQDDFSPFDESLTFDSIEGVAMQVDYTIIGKVVDPWKFYDNFGVPQEDYSIVDGIQDKKIYEAIRVVGDYIDSRMNELAQEKEAEYIRKFPQEFYNQLTIDAQNYIKDFGFQITQIIFPNPIKFLGKNKVEEARDTLQKAYSDLEKKNNDRILAEQERAQKIANAKLEAQVIISTATRKSQKIKIETDALSSNIAASIDQVGKENAMKIYMSQQMKDVIEADKVKTVYIENSFNINSK